MFPSTPVPSSTSSDSTAPTVQDRRINPSGILPRHLQTWVVLGIAVLMTGIIALSGSSRPAPDKKAVVSLGTTAIAPNDARIQEYRTRLDEEVRRLSAAQAELDTAKRALTAAPAPTTTEAAPTSMSSIGASSDNGLAREQAERAYKALFADNVAFSLRKEKPAITPPAAVPGAVLPPVAIGAPTAGGAGVDLGAGPPKVSHGESVSLQGASPAPPPVANETSRTKDSVVRRFPVLEGTIIEAVLTNRLDGSFAGPVNGMVTTAVYSQDRQHVLIPQGSRLLGEAKAVASFGQQRLAVAFHRLITPDGVTVTLDQFKGLSQAGATGLQDQVDHHYVQLFGTSLAIAAIAGLAQADTRVGVEATGVDLYQQGVASSAAQSSLHILDRFLNVLPTVTIREGQRLKVYLSGDLEVPAYGESHD